MEKLLRHWDRILEAMTEEERALVAKGTRDMLSGAAIVFARLKGGKKYALGTLGWFTRQIVSERKPEQMIQSLRAKAEKGAPHVAAILQTL